MSKIYQYLKKAKEIADNDYHGYCNEVNHNLGYPDFDCGTFVSECLHSAGLCVGEILEPNEPYGAWGYERILTEAGFIKMRFSFAKVKTGDILIKDGQHTEMVFDEINKLTIGAHDDYDGYEGDSSGDEISIAPMSSYWDWIFRLTEENEDYIISCGKTEYHGWQEEVINDTDTVGITNEALTGIAIKCDDIRYSVYDAINGWNEEVSGYDISDYLHGYAGDDEPISGLIIFSKKPILYRVKLLRSQEWLEWVDSADADYNDEEYGFAGIIGKTIDEVEIKLK